MRHLTDYLSQFAFLFLYRCLVLRLIRNVKLLLLFPIRFAFFPSQSAHKLCRMFSSIRNLTMNFKSESMWIFVSLSCTLKFHTSPACINHREWTSPQPSGISKESAVRSQGSAFSSRILIGGPASNSRRCSALQVVVASCEIQGNA